MKAFQTVLVALPLAAAAVPACAKPLNALGITVPSFSNPYFTSLLAGAKAKALAINPGVKVLSESPEYDLSKQAAIFDTFRSAHVDAIVIAATDAKADTPLVKQAEAAGIVVIGADSPVPGVDAGVLTDNEQLGREVCGAMVKRLGGKGDVVILNGQSVAPIIARVKGCHEALAGVPGIKVLSDDQNGGSSRSGGLDVMQGLLTRFPHIDAVFAINDQEAIGASLAAKQQHRTDPVFYGADGAPDAVEAIKDSSSAFVATGAQDPYAIGARAVAIAADLLNGKKPAQTIEMLQPTLVTRETVGSYKGWAK